MRARGTKTAQASRRGGSLALLALGILVACLALFLLPASSTAQSSPKGRDKITFDLSEKLKSASSDDLVPLIVLTTGEPSDPHITRLHGRGGLLKARHQAIHGYSASLPASQVEAFADDPEVVHISYDSPVKAHMDVAYPAVKANAAYSDFGLSGSGVGIAIVDTGVATHPDLLRSRGSQQVVEVEIVGHEAGLADYYGHGTHVAGIINGNGASSTGPAFFRTFKGLAPGAQILSIRALSPDGTGYTSDIISGIDWAIKFQKNYNIRVLNLSLGHPVFESYTTDPLCQAVRAAYDAGMLAVVAAGNDGAIGTGFGTIDSPGNEPSALTVGALDDSGTVTTTDDVLAWYSSKGPSLVDFVVKPDLVAPGSHIVSLRDPGSYLDTNYHQFALKLGDYKVDPLNATSDGLYYTLSGTSMAAPMAAGAAALLFQNDPSLNPATVKARLMASAVKDSHLVFETGAGELDVDAALKASGYASSALSPLATLASDGNVYVQDTSLIWGSLWSLSLVWGGNKGLDYGILLTDVSPDVLAALSLVWGGKVGNESLIWNNAITASGLIWGGQGCWLLSTSGSVVQSDSGVWGGKH